MGNYKKTKQNVPFSDEFKAKLLPKSGGEIGFLLSLVLATYNCSEFIRETLDSIGCQKYPCLEVIVIDAGSTDRTLDVVHSYGALVNRIYSVTHYNIADMFNRGISLASGTYITFLYPGALYLSHYAFQTFTEKIHEDDLPDLVYSGCIQRECHNEPQSLLHSFDKNFLEKGRSITAIPACWFRRDLFDKMGRFDTRYTHRFGFDLLCRLACMDQIRILKIERIFVDFDFGTFTYGKAARIAFETWSILCRHFGMGKAIRWSLSMNHFMLFKWIWGRFKYHLSKK